MKLEELNDSARYQVANQGAIAWRFAAAQVSVMYDEWGDDVDQELTGMVWMVMIGDDRRWLFDPEDVSEIDDEDYCSGCGQIGCGWG